MMHPVYMVVTQDKYELPIAWAESAWELARMLGVDVTSILRLTAMARGRPILKRWRRKLFSSGC